MSTAEAVSVYYQTLMSAWYYGGPEQAGTWTSGRWLKI